MNGIVQKDLHVLCEERNVQFERESCMFLEHAPQKTSAWVCFSQNHVAIVPTIHSPLNIVILHTPFYGGIFLAEHYLHAIALSLESQRVGVRGGMSAIRFGPHEPACRTIRIVGQ
ncbi:hypothetical protein CDAR_85111 [Caerostris darwini]|uniref:Uncharacterized protein n=1 Tax=Caerostris darwini TaxID=1538125 RepID=A0AAV4N2E1_9ARAC|nr:hypothetical protein CDAR_85111 [Caerostris darwini]